MLSLRQSVIYCTPQALCCAFVLYQSLIILDAYNKEWSWLSLLWGALLDVFQAKLATLRTKSVKIRIIT